MYVAPSPNPQAQVVGPLVEASVTVTASGAVPLVGVTLKAATGPATTGVMGTVRSCAEAVDENVIDWPPKKTARSGVTRVKRPSTEIETVSPRTAVAGGQTTVEQVIVTSVGATVTNPPWASLRARHMTRFDSAFTDVQVVFAMYEVGFFDASSTASRAASLTVIRE